MYDDGIELGELEGWKSFRRKLKRSLKKGRRKLKLNKVGNVARKITRKVGPKKMFKKFGPVTAFKKITRKIGPVKMFKKFGPVTAFKKITKKIGPVKMFKKYGPIRVFKKVHKKLNPVAVYKHKWGAGGIMKRFGPTKVLKKTRGLFKTATPRGKFKRKGLIIGGTAAAAAAAAAALLYARNKKAKETSLLTEPATSPLVRKVGATPLSKSVVVNVTAPSSGGGGMYRTAQPRDAGGKVIRGKNDMIKKAAMIGIPAVLGVGALYMLMRKK